VGTLHRNIKLLKRCFLVGNDDDYDDYDNKPGNSVGVVSLRAGGTVRSLIRAETSYFYHITNIDIGL
jgi:hypothetical protein